MKKCPFNQTVRQSDKEEVEGIKQYNDIIYRALMLFKSKTKSGAVLLYLSLRMVFGGGSKVCGVIFDELLKIYHKDEELHKYHENGVRDASKMMPHVHHTDMKKKCAYEEGKKKGIF